MGSIRERVNLFVYQSAICTSCRPLLFNCFETARFSFASAKLETSSDAETCNFIIISDIKGLLISLGHLNLYCLTREMHFHYVASGHLSLIKNLAFVFVKGTNLHVVSFPCCVCMRLENALDF